MTSSSSGIKKFNEICIVFHLTEIINFYKFFLSMNVENQEIVQFVMFHLMFDL